MKNVFFLLLLFTGNICVAQGLVYTRKIVDTLTSETFWGRGYTNNGMQKAAGFIESQFRSIGLQPMQNNSYRQYFSFPVNTFPGKMKVRINGTELRPGVDFIIGPASTGLSAQEVSLTEKDSITFLNLSHKVMVGLRSKLTWPVARNVDTVTQILLNSNALPEKPATISIDVENKFEPAFVASNITGIIRGTQYPDRMIVLTAHYDHLGGMGRTTYFPGANDNASGVGLLLSIAKYYAANPPAYSIGFICFGAEEAGLIGSKYFTENPLVPLESIKFLINLDLVGTGEAGMTVVNASILPDQFALLNTINNREQLITKINSRGKAANSDHYWFTEKGVPAFFIYTQGGISAYHDVFDKAATLPFTAYYGLFKLITTFNRELMQ